jgi:radical SAM protein with 4Fe4S-binding SPASM domain
MLTVDSFNSKDHIDFRNQRYFEIEKNNSKLLGLSTVEINPTELCNRTCSFCPRHDPSVYPNQNLHMTVDTATALVSQLTAARFTGDIHITGFGEPLLNPNILDIVKDCSSNFTTELITNGDRLLNSYYSHEQLTAAGLHFLIVDCYDGDDQYLKIKKILSTCNIPYRIRNHHDTGQTNLIEVYNFNNRGGMLSKQSSLQKPCWLPFYKVLVDWNGDVIICCNDWNRNQKFNNIHNLSIDQIWMSEEFITIRKDLETGNRNKISSCVSCNTNGILQGKDSVELWKKQF